MRLICLFIFVGLMQVSAATYSQSTKLSLSGRNLSIEQVLSRIEDQSDYSFFYNVKEVDLSKLVNLDVRNRSIEDVLNMLMDGTDLTYTINNKLIIIHKNQDAGFSSFSVQQKLTVSGRVTSADGNPIPGATIAVKGTA
ncbi:MAG TPA: secretin and TonB N-terminal domain-containing protein, partial [Sunxiuqinia sp.]|nr:secretin and TonB N-terminal domain-containing protein [Sunxiuqinia sp.]